MDYLQYETADFVWDDAFTAWVKNGEQDAFWREFERLYPQKGEAMARARAIITAASHLPAQLPGADMKKQLWEGILLQVAATDAGEGKAPPVTRNRRWWWAAAAAVLIAGSLTWWLAPRPGSAPVYQQLLQQAGLEENERIEAVNENNKPLWVNLPDGSSVVLQPGGRLSYTPDLRSQRQREVYLSGAAFFEIAGKAQQPFVVYANELVIRVLGTSFSVQAYEQEKEVQVLVKTGKIAVYAQPVVNREPATTADRKELIVLPNQQATLKRGALYLSTKEKPTHTLLKTPAETSAFVFEDTPAEAVLDTIQQAYGVHIVYDKTLLAGCRLTASLTDEPLHEKIRLICKALEASCIINDQEIVIQSRGCK